MFDFRRDGLRAAAAGALAAVGLATAAHATADARVQGAASRAQAATPTCTIKLGKAQPGKLSPVRSRRCGTGAEARKLAANETLLMEWFENIDNSPPSLTRVTADDGPCDADGYRLRTGWGWSNVISGFNAYSDCEVATGYDLENLSGDREQWSANHPCSCLLVPWVGGFINDRIESFWIRAH